MKGDFTRSTFKRENHYSGVRMQQGKVQLDADWNEQVDITSHHTETGASDIIGRCGSRISKPGEDDFKNFKIAVNDPDHKDFLVAPGHIYVDGILCENDAPSDEPTRGSVQPDLPDLQELPLDMNDKVKPFTPLPVPGGTYLAVLDVWQRHITYLDDPEIREKALGGPDTATRTKSVWQVKLLRIGAGEVNCLSASSEWNELLRGSTGKLNAREVKGTEEKNPCILPSTGGYRRLKNNLYRVEIHEVNKAADGDTVTFKWSRDNGTVVVEWESTTDNKLKVKDPGHGVLSNFENEDKSEKWVELIDDTRELWGLPGTLVKLDKVEGEFLVIDPETARGSIDRGSFPRHPKVRLWDWVEDFNTKSDTLNFKLQDDGIEISFKPGSDEMPYRTGDYWLIPARTQDAKIEWPKDASNNGVAQEPHGIRHHYCRLAVLRADSSGNLTLVEDCRRLFPAVTELTNLFYVSGDGQEAMPAEELPEPLCVGVSNGQWPTEGARIKFEIMPGEDSTGELALTEGGQSGGTSQVAETGSDGVAKCYWKLGKFVPIPENPYASPPPQHLYAPPPPQQVKATLLDDNDKPIHLPVFFNANLSVASEVAYFPQGCESMVTTTTIQEAIDRLSQLASLSYLSGDGQEAMPGEPLPQKLQVIVTNECGPVQGAEVTFMAEGDGRVASDKSALENEETPNTLPATTGTDGIASCYWQPDENGSPSQTLTATLTGTGGNPMHAPTSIVFTASLSIAAEVAYTPPSGCTNLTNDTTVQEAIDRLSQLPDIFYVSGDGQEAMPDKKLPKPLQIRVASKCGPVNKAKIKFEITDGYEDCAHLEPGSSEVIENTGKMLTILTDSDGIAECYLKLGEKYEHQVEATIIDPAPLGGKSTNIRFNANLSVARRVEYDPQDCNNLKDIDTVQQAIDRLCWNSTLYYISGDGQEALPDQKIPDPLQVRVANGKWPVIAAHIKFIIKEGYDAGARLEPGSSTVIENLGDKLTVLTGADGIAECYLRLGSNDKHHVEATLLDAVMMDHFGDPIVDDSGNQVHPSVRFNASLSVASGMAYDPKVCSNLKKIKTVQDALDTFCGNITLYYVSGDGQETMPDPTQEDKPVKLPKPLQVRVANGKWPVPDAQVKFAITGANNGILSGNGVPGAEIVVPTDPDGIASCNWELDPTIYDQQVEATLVTPAPSDADGKTINIPVRFNASLSMADRVAYIPSLECPELKNIKTVKAAIDELCHRKGIPQDLILSSLKLKCAGVPEEKKWPELRCELGDLQITGGNMTINGRLSCDSVAGALSQLPPTGTVLAFAGQSAPEGYLLCDGQAVSRQTYARLFSVIGTTYGAGDGATTFNVCNLRGRAIVGTGQGPGLTSRALGEKFGEETHKLSVAELPPHQHSGVVSNAPDHSHGASVVANGDHSHNCTSTGHSHSGETGTANANPYRVVHQAGEDSLENHVNGWAGGPYTDKTRNEEFPGRIHTHPFSVDGGFHGHSIQSAGSHSHTLAVSAGGSHGHAFTTDTGHGQNIPQNNLPPSLALNFIIKT